MVSREKKVYAFFLFLQRVELDSYFVILIEPFVVLSEISDPP